MKIIRILLIIALCYFSIEKGYKYLSLRNTLNQDSNEENQKEIKKALFDFLKILALTVIYIGVKLS